MTNPIIPVFTTDTTTCRGKAATTATTASKASTRNCREPCTPPTSEAAPRRYLAQYWSAYVHSDYAGGDAVIATLEQIDFVHRMCARYPETFKLATTADDDARRAGRRPHRLADRHRRRHQIANNMAVLREYARASACAT